MSLKSLNLKAIAKLRAITYLKAMAKLRAITYLKAIALKL